MLVHIQKTALAFVRKATLYEGRSQNDEKFRLALESLLPWVALSFIHSNYNALHPFKHNAGNEHYEKTFHLERKDERGTKNHVRTFMLLSEIYAQIKEEEDTCKSQKVDPKTRKRCPQYDNQTRL